MINIFPIPEQTWNSQTYADNARFVAELGMPVVEWLSPQPGERILDLGCGDGALTVKLLDCGCDVVGVDASADLIQAAQFVGLDARVMNGQSLTFEQEFDAVFTNAALHWMQRSEQVIQGVWQALKPGGRFVGEFGGYGNVATIHQALMSTIAKHGHDPAALNPWFFPKPEEYQTQLEAVGFAVNQIKLIPRPTPLPTGVRGWLETFANPFTQAISVGQRGEFIDQIQAIVAPVLQNNAGHWIADYVRLRFYAVKPD